MAAPSTIEGDEPGVAVGAASSSAERGHATSGAVAPEAAVVADEIVRTPPTAWFVTGPAGSGRTTLLDLVAAASDAGPRYRIVAHRVGSDHLRLADLVPDLDPSADPAGLAAALAGATVLVDDVHHLGTAATLELAGIAARAAQCDVRLVVTTRPVVRGSARMALAEASTRRRLGPLDVDRPAMRSLTGQLSPEARDRVIEATGGWAELVVAATTPEGIDRLDDDLRLRLGFCAPSEQRLAWALALGARPGTEGPTVATGLDGEALDAALDALVAVGVLHDHAGPVPLVAERLRLLVPPGSRRELVDALVPLADAAALVVMADWLVSIGEATAPAASALRQAARLVGPRRRPELLAAADAIDPSLMSADALVRSHLAGGDPGAALRVITRRAVSPTTTALALARAGRATDAVALASSAGGAAGTSEPRSDAVVGDVAFDPQPAGAAVQSLDDAPDGEGTGPGRPGAGRVLAPDANANSIPRAASGVGESETDPIVAPHPTVVAAAVAAMGGAPAEADELLAAAPSAAVGATAALAAAARATLAWTTGDHDPVAATIAARRLARDGVDLAGFPLDPECIAAIAATLAGGRPTAPLPQREPGLSETPTEPSPFDDDRALTAAWVAMRTGRTDDARAMLHGPDRPGAGTPRGAALDVALALRVDEPSTLARRLGEAAAELDTATPDAWSLALFADAVPAAARSRVPLDGLVAALEEWAARAGSASAVGLVVAVTRLVAAQAADDDLAVIAAAEAISELPGDTPMHTLARRFASVAGEIHTGRVDADAVLDVVAALRDAGLAHEAARLAGAAAVRTDDEQAARSLLKESRSLRAPRRVLAGAAGSAGLDDIVVEPLSDREIEVARLVIEGRTHKQIGGELYISAKTVEHHVARIRTKLGASNRAEMMAAIRSYLDAVD